MDDPSKKRSALDGDGRGVAKSGMKQTIATMTLVVADYDEAIAFYRDRVGFALIEDTDMGGGKRWVLVGPATGGTRLLLAQAHGGFGDTAFDEQGVKGPNELKVDLVEKMRLLHIHFQISVMAIYPWVNIGFALGSSDPQGHMGHVKNACLPS